MRGVNLEKKKKKKEREGQKGWGAVKKTKKQYRNKEQ